MWRCAGLGNVFKSLFDDPTHLTGLRPLSTIQVYVFMYRPSRFSTFSAWVAGALLCIFAGTFPQFPPYDYWCLSKGPEYRELQGPTVTC
jgi:hypothetical protein